MTASSAFKTFTAVQSSESYKFGPYRSVGRGVFYTTKLSFVMVNPRPVIPGHVLVCPRREVKRFGDLTAGETSDLWITAQKTSSLVPLRINSSSKPEEEQSKFMRSTLGKLPAPDPIPRFPKATLSLSELKLLAFGKSASGISLGVFF